MNNLLRFLAFVFVVESVCAESNNSAQQAGSWTLTVVEVLMYPGSSAPTKQTAIATYDSQLQCEAARRNIDAKFNSSTKCILKKKTKVNI